MGRDGKSTETSSFQLSLLFLPGFTNAIGSTSEQRSPGYMLIHDCGRECDMFCIERSKCDDLSFFEERSWDQVSPGRGSSYAHVDARLCS